ncbi:hypothetical protein D7036_24615 [Aquimarina sp. BL5]|nr:hypothetical protein D7036_24615 [Aquimarina sp. BL5]
MNSRYLCIRENEYRKTTKMITQLVTKGKEKRDDKIKITRLTKANIVNTGLMTTSERLAKAYSINL